MSLKVLICLSRFHLKFVKLCRLFTADAKRKLSDFKLLPLIQINGDAVNGGTWYQSGHSVKQIIFDLNLYHLNDAFAINIWDKT